MSRREGTRRRASTKPVVVLVGEDSNDRECLRIALETFGPRSRGRLVDLNKLAVGPLSNPAEAGDMATLRERVNLIGRHVDARVIRENAELACVFVQEDLDRADGEHSDLVRERVQRALEKRFDRAHYVLAVAELEAWLLLFPDALCAVDKSWQLPARLRGRDTGRISDPKQVLRREVGDARGRRYSERDAPKVMAKAEELGCLSRPEGRNRSWTALTEHARTCEQDHLVDT